MKILLVDDEIVALNALKKRVDWVKYDFTEVYTASDTATAREILGKEKINVILCDVEMPDESGLELIAYIKQTYPSICSIMCTCHAEFDYVQKAMRYGARDYILKPIDYEELDNLLIQLRDELREQQDKNQLGKLVEKKMEEYVEDVKDGNQDSNEARLKCVKAYIEDHIQEKITVGEIAKQVHINEQYLMRIFKRETGQSVLEYLTERRIVIASRLLKETDYSINFIADCVGCENSSYFTKLFKKYTGFSPREYRLQFKQ